jgi:acyl carrier protein phosphodiesterase
LTLSWDQYSSISLDVFISSFHSNAAAVVNSYPERAQQVVHGIIRSGYLTSYSDMDGLSRALERIDARLSRKGKVKRPASGYMPLIETNMDELKNDFSEFFPSLLSLFRSESGIKTHPWLKF